MENDFKGKSEEALKFLAWGYKTAIVLSILGLLFSAGYLYIFISQSHPDLIKIETMTGFSAERRMALLSTGIFVAMAFGFLGFALFLIQAKGEVEGSFEAKDFKITIARMSPGLFVIMCSTIIIIFCSTFPIEYTVRQIPVSQTDSTKNSFQVAPDVNLDFATGQTYDSANKVDTVNKKKRK